jgi:hypothetical protein
MHGEIEMNTTVARVPLKRPLLAVAPDLNLDQRIKAAFEGRSMSSDVVAALIEEVSTAVIESAEAVELARAQALDPRLATSAIDAARALLESAEFRQQRLTIAVTKLKERLAWLREQEEDAKRTIAYEKVEAERDELARELAQVYPEAAQRIAELLGRVSANDKEIERINTKLPSDRGAILGAELTARGLRNFQVGPQGLSHVPKITRDVHLPAFQYDPSAQYLWPIRRTIFD